MKKQLKKFFSELKRRRVFGSVAWYIGFAVVIIGIRSETSDSSYWPEWITLDRTILFFLAALPVVIFLSWFYDLQAFIKSIKSLFIEEHGESEAPARNLELENLDSLTHRATNSLPDNSIAILPFANISDVDSENAYFADGIHEEILTQLSKIAKIKVISRRTTLQFKSTTLTPQEIARKLNVQQVLEGSVRFWGNRVRINTDLVQASDNSLIWSETYEREFKDIFNIQLDVAVNVANAMKIKLNPEDLARIEKPATQNMEAYKIFLKAIAREKQGNSIQQEGGGWVESGIKDMEQVIRLDPVFARAYAHLGWLQTLKRFDVFPDPGIQFLKSAQANAEKALELDQNVVRAYSVLAFVAFERHEYEKWEAFDRKAISFPDAHPGPYILFGDRMGRRGRFQEAYELFDQAVAMDPLRTITREYATYYHILGGDFQEALHLADYFLAAGGSEGGYHLYRAICFTLMKELDRARSELEKFPGKFVGLNFNLPIMWSYAVTKTGGKNLIAQSIRNAKTDTERAFLSFGSALATNDLDAAFSILDGYMRSGHVVSDMGPFFRSLKKDPRWSEVQRYIETPFVV